MGREGRYREGGGERAGWGRRHLVSVSLSLIILQPSVSNPITLRSPVLLYEAKECSEKYSWATPYPASPRLYLPVESQTVRSDKL